MANALIRRLEAYVRLSADDRKALLLAAGEGIRTFDARRDLMREGDEPRVVNLILSGWACRYKTLPDGRRQIVALFVPGDLCDPHIYILKRMDHNVGAITPVTAAQVGRDSFERLISERPRIVQALWWHELVVTAIQREWTLNIGQRTAYERMAHLMVEMFLRLQTVGMAEGNSIEWPLTQLDLADATGLTPVHVNRTLQAMRRDGLIELAGRRLTILDMAALKSTAMFNPEYLHLEHEGAHLDANE
ncbi:Crp/Fnr family transcriptional regulator [Sphingomonas ginkgonis]|uniref:Crp/Fnr family transcriptional regulator n=1 Tax=Sphingomonas ginkgonis TaxID=2315330 RepID=A0A3R9WP27_9SPHN|nr:Crp/Fnr family transcriptional regulator [Sphingomonas ginkgonis]